MRIAVQLKTKNFFTKRTNYQKGLEVLRSQATKVPKGNESELKTKKHLK
jgi:hypothetical protein